MTGRSVDGLIGSLYKLYSLCFKLKSNEWVGSFTSRFRQYQRELFQEMNEYIVEVSNTKRYKLGLIWGKVLAWNAGEVI